MRLSPESFGGVNGGSRHTGLSGGSRAGASRQTSAASGPPAAPAPSLCQQGRSSHAARRVRSYPVCLLLRTTHLAQEDAIRTPLPLLVLVMFWFVVIYVSFSLLAPRNVITIAMILFSSAAIGGAIRMTTVLQMPFEGIVRISSTPLGHALAVVSH